jgi:hypothetical protein
MKPKRITCVQEPRPRPARPVPFRLSSLAHSCPFVDATISSVSTWSKATCRLGPACVTRTDTVGHKEPTAPPWMVPRAHRRGHPEPFITLWASETCRMKCHVSEGYKPDPYSRPPLTAGMHPEKRGVRRFHYCADPIPPFHKPGWRSSVKGVTPWCNQQTQKTRET